MVIQAWKTEWIKSSSLLGHIRRSPGLGRPRGRRNLLEKWKIGRSPPSRTTTKKALKASTGLSFFGAYGSHGLTILCANTVVPIWMKIDSADLQPTRGWSITRQNKKDFSLRHTGQDPPTGRRRQKMTLIYFKCQNNREKNIKNNLGGCRVEIFKERRGASLFSGALRWGFGV